MARGIEIDWVVVRVHTLRRLLALAATALVAAALLAFVYSRLHLPPQAQARRAIERAERAQAQVKDTSVPEVWAGELTQAVGQLNGARQAYAGEEWSHAQELANAARQRFEALLGAGDRQVVGAGQIFTLDGGVSVQRAGKPEWLNAHERMPIFNGDFVRTGSDGSAEILFSDGSLYRVAPNTLLEVHNPVQAQGTGTVKMVVGRINVYTSAAPSTVATDVVTTQVERDSRVAVNVSGEDHKTEVAAYSGTARVTNPAGQQVVLSDREQVTSAPDGSFSAKGRLPSPPELLEPRNNATYELESEPIITLRWRTVSPTASGVHLQVSRSKRFIEGGMDVDATRTGRDEARLKAVAPGTYYWRLATVDESGQQSEWSTVRRFQIVSTTRRPLIEDHTPPELEVEPASQMGHLFIVEGHTEAGATVTINGEPVEVDGDGHFRKAVEVTDEGWNDLVVEAVDPAGNRTERRQRVFVEVF